MNGSGHGNAADWHPIRPSRLESSIQPPFSNAGVATQRTHRGRPLSPVRLSVTTKKTSDRPRQRSTTLRWRTAAAQTAGDSQSPKSFADYIHSLLFFLCCGYIRSHWSNLIGRQSFRCCSGQVNICIRHIRGWTRQTPPSWTTKGITAHHCSASTVIAFNWEGTTEENPSKHYICYYYSGILSNSMDASLRFHWETILQFIETHKIITSDVSEREGNLQKSRRHVSVFRYLRVFLVFQLILKREVAHFSFLILCFYQSTVSLFHSHHHYCYISH